MIKARTVKEGDYGYNNPQVINEPKEKKNILWLEISVSIFVAVFMSVICLFFAVNQNNWFLNLNKPNFYPPKFVFIILFFLNLVSFFVLFFTLFHKKLINKNLYALFLFHLVILSFFAFTLFILHKLFFAMVSVIALIVIVSLFYYEIKIKNKKSARWIFVHFFWLFYLFLIIFFLFLMN